ncbi:MAG: hypothetical protein EHM61_23870 [Acidobacteria bacterium]|nr:MAG: hypothetical protein EHM61_23870 [Acidobacteriota bacterium]
MTKRSTAVSLTILILTLFALPSQTVHAAVHLSPIAGFPMLGPASDDPTYDRGVKALDEKRWADAVQSFDEVVRVKSARSDAALYWKAYALNKLGRRADAVTSLQTLGKTYPTSGWLDDAKALELEMRQASGQPVSPDNTENEDLKLMAIDGLLASDPDRAIPMLEKILQGNQSAKIKERALFVLAQGGSVRAEEIVITLARNSAQPELQAKAIQFIGLSGRAKSRQALAQLYASATSPEVKRAVLSGLMLSGDRERLIAIAKEEKSAELKGEAINQLGVLGAKTELWQMYESAGTAGEKEAILNALFVAGDVDKLIQVAQTEKDPQTRGAAIQRLGVSHAQKTSAILVSMYQTEKDPEIRTKVLDALFVQGNATVLIDFARKEKDPQLRKEIVSRLSIMRSKEATDYMMEILNKE